MTFTQNKSSLLNLLVHQTQSFLWDEINKILRENIGDVYKSDLVDISELCHDIFERKIIEYCVEDIKFLKNNFSFNLDICKTLLCSYLRPSYPLLAQKCLKIVQKVANVNLINDEMRDILILAIDKKIEQWFDSIVDIASKVFFGDYENYFIVRSTEEIKTIFEQKDIIVALKDSQLELQTKIEDLERGKSELISEHSKQREIDFLRKDQEKDEMVSYIKKITKDTEMLVSEHTKIKSRLEEAISQERTRNTSLSFENSRLKSTSTRLKADIKMLEKHKKNFIISTCFLSVVVLVLVLVIST